MKKGIHFLSLVIVFTMLLPLIAGVAAFAEGTGDRVTITYSMWGNDEELRVLNEAIAKFESEQDKIHVEAIQIDRADYVGALNTRAAGNDLPRHRYHGRGRGTHVGTAGHACRCEQHVRGRRNLSRWIALLSPLRENP